MAIKKYYIYDENGTILSEDRKTRYTLLTGSEALSFLHTAAGKGRHFYHYTDEHGDSVFVECTHERSKERNTEIKREKRARELREKLNITFVSADAPVEGTDTFVAFVDTFVDENIDIQIDYERKEASNALALAITMLTPDEYELIYHFYLRKDPLSEREYGRFKNIPQRTVHDAKMRAFCRLKKYFWEIYK